MGPAPRGAGDSNAAALPAHGMGRQGGRHGPRLLEVLHELGDIICEVVAWHRRRRSPAGGHDRARLARQHDVGAPLELLLGHLLRSLLLALVVVRLLPITCGRGPTQTV